MNGTRDNLNAADRLFLELACELAGGGEFTSPPNPRVGCVLVRDGEVIGRGWHVRAGQAHAEINALKDADNDAAGATAYVSLEPCSFAGRTPACADALVVAGVERVVVALLDPHPRVGGRGVDRLKSHGIEVDVVELPQARRNNPGYLKRHEQGLPYVRLKLAMSVDGRIALASGESQWITGTAARQDVQRWRARSCAILTGIGTVLADDPRLNVRDRQYAAGDWLRQPMRVVADSRLRTPAAAQLFSAPGEVLLAHNDYVQPPDDVAATFAAAAVDSVQHLACGRDQVDLRRLLEHLAQCEVNEVLVEAGPTLSGALLETELWDEVLIYLAPKFLGSDAKPLADLSFERLQDVLTAQIVACEPVGEDLRLTLTPMR